MIHHAVSVAGFVIFAGIAGCFPAIDERLRGER
jgi:hypothetical protein